MHFVTLSVCPLHYISSTSIQVCVSTKLLMAQHSVVELTLTLALTECLQCFDAVGWAARRAFGL